MRTREGCRLAELHDALEDAARRLGCSPEARLIGVFEAGEFLADGQLVHFGEGRLYAVEPEGGPG